MKSVYNQRTYILPLTKEIKGAKYYIGYFTPYLSETAIDIWEPELRDAIARGVRVCIFVEMPERWGESDLPPHFASNHDWLRKNMKRLEDMGAHVNMARNFHPKVLIIDFIVVWSGSINFLSSNPYKRFEKVDRDDDWVAVVTAYFRLNFECCLDCQNVEWKKIRGAKVIDTKSLDASRLLDETSDPNPSSPNEKPFSKVKATSQDVDDEPVGKWISAIRQSLKLSANELAKITKLDRNSLRFLESGKTMPSLKVLVPVLEALGYSLIIVPTHTVSVHRRIGKGYSKSELEKHISTKKHDQQAT